MRTKLLLLLSFALMGWSNVWAYDQAVEGTMYYGWWGEGIGLSDGTVCLTKCYSGSISNGTVTIPATLQKFSNVEPYGLETEYEVSTVGNSSAFWFDATTAWNATTVTKLVFSEGIKNIGANAFQHMTALTTIELPSSLSSLGQQSFEQCDALTSVTFKSATAPTYGSNAFATSADPWYHTNCIVTVPEGSMDSYGNSSNWYWNQIRWTAHHMREAANITIGEVGYATYYNDHGYILPKGLEGYVIDWTSGTTANLNKIYKAGDEVYAGTNSQFALLLKRTDSDGGNKTFTLSVLSSGGETATWPDGLSANLLCGSQNGGETTAWGTSSTDYCYYKLANDATYGLGWYYGDKTTKNGSAFTSAAHKAWLVVSKSAGARSFISMFDNETTGITDVRGKMEDVKGTYYDLSGRRVAQPSKGLYIVNGKKVVVK